jgi:hypothetical protein
MKRIYLADPVSGRPREERAAHFAGIEKEIVRKAAPGLSVTTFNPVRFCNASIEPNAPWHICLRACIGKLAECDGIGLLQGWEKSRGALLELNTAINLKIPVVDLEPPLGALDMYMFFGREPAREIYYYYLQHLDSLEAINPDTAEDRALIETANRYLDPYGFEYIEVLF